MGAGRSFIHVGGCDRPTIPGDFDQLIDFLHGGDVVFSKVLNENTAFLIRSDLQVVLISVQQIFQLLHIKFHQGNLDPELHVLIEACNRVEDMLDHTGNDTRLLADGLTDGSLHRVGLSGGGLSVCEDGAVEAFDNAIDDGCGSIGVDFCLRGVHIEDLIEGELQGLFLLFTDGKGLVIQYLMAMGCPEGFFFLVQWTETTDYLYVGSCPTRCGVVVGSSWALLRGHGKNVII